jgi:energy-converting hydrogenase Eha subunit C
MMDNIYTIIFILLEFEVIRIHEIKKVKHKD